MNEGGKTKRGWHWLRAYAEALLIAVLLALFARTFLVQGFRIPSASMADGLQIGDHVLVNKFIFRAPSGDFVLQRLLPMRSIDRGDVVVFRFPTDPSRDFIKRCVGLPGDIIAISDGGLAINEQIVNESAYLKRPIETMGGQSPRSTNSAMRASFGPLTVPPDHFFCLGDNRDDSYDSRFWGPVPSANIIGRAWLVYWSVERPQATPRHDRLANAVASVMDSLTAVRLDRCLRLVR